MISVNTDVTTLRGTLRYIRESIELLLKAGKDPYDEDMRGFFHLYWKISSYLKLLALRNEIRQFKAEQDSIYAIIGDGNDE